MRLIRWYFSQKATIGSLFINDDFECFTIEDTDRGLKQSMSLDEINRKKIYGTTCIPYGRYQVIVSPSMRFSAKAGKVVILPLIKDVPGYAGIRIHVANFATQILGCIAVGKSYGKDVVWSSKDAFNDLFPKINSAFDKKEEIFITITRSNFEPKTTDL